jgi:peroxiredoxin
MQQVVDLQRDRRFRSMGIELLSISPDPIGAWKQQDESLGITLPTLSDARNRVASRYGVMKWGMPTNEPGHTFVLVDAQGTVAWVRDYGAPEHGGLMYVSPNQLVSELASHLGGSGG